jgi:hypothetical protein
MAEDQPMKITVAIVAIVVAVFFIVPMLVGGSANVCQALEQHNVSKTASSIAGGRSGPIYGVINTIGQAGATGHTEAAMQANAHPGLPTVIDCTLSFWQSF